MTEDERAAQYCSLFEHCGDRWRDVVPVDGKAWKCEDKVRIGSVTIARTEAGTWAPIGDPA